MNEFWLGLNVVVETLKPALWVWIALMVLWLALVVVAVRNRGAQWRRVLPTVSVIALLAALLVLFLGPTLTASSLTHVNYWVDWAFLGASSIALGVLLAILIWPAMAMLARKT